MTARPLAVLQPNEAGFLTCCGGGARRQSWTREPRTQVTDLPPLRRPLARGFALLVRGYRRWLSPLLPPSCRFHPSCSQYAMLALATHRLPRALALTAWRLLRCQPLCAGGVDFPPAGPYGDGEQMFAARTSDGLH